jgi:hypothetical protein
MERCDATESIGVSVTRGVTGFNEEANATGWYTAQCFGADGQLKWEEEFQNLVVTQGKNYLLDQGFAASSTNVLRMGLKLVGTALAADTYASHSSWAESTVYSGSRATPAFSAASAGSKTTSSVAVFNINGTATITGCFLVMAPTTTTLGTIGDTSATGAVLYSAGDFSASKSVTSGDTLNVTYTAAL